MFWDTVCAWPQFKTAKVAATHKITWGWDMTVKAVLCTSAVNPGLLFWAAMDKAGCEKAILAGSRSCHWSTCSDTRKHISL